MGTVANGASHGQDVEIPSPFVEVSPSIDVSEPTNGRNGLDAGNHQRSGPLGDTLYRRAPSVGTLSYLTSMVFARNPIDLHRQFAASNRYRSIEGESSRHVPPSMRKPLVADGGEDETGRVRFQKAVGKVLRGLSFRRHIQGLESPDTRGAERFAHLVAIEGKLENHPHKNEIIAALRKRAGQDYKGISDRLGNELFILGERIFRFCTPKELNKHPLIFTWVFFLLLAVPFFYMAGEFPRWLGSEEDPLAANAGRARSNLLNFGPDALWDWITKRGDSYKFDSFFLIDWGGRYIPKMEQGAEVHRWITSLLIHQHFAHLFNNSIIFLLFSTHLEHKYGTLRIGGLCVLSGIGGNLLSAAFENACVVVVGASGCCFGLMGLFVADMILNIEHVSFPILRTLFLILMLVLFVFTLLTEGNTSHVSHVGGFLAGLFPSFIFLPNLKYAKWEAILPYLGGLTMIFFYVFLPFFVYLDIIPSNGCAT